MNGKAMTAEAFSAAEDRPVTEFALDPKLYGDGAFLLLHVWDGESRSEFERIWMTKDAKQDPGGFRWSVISRTVCDKDGDPLFVEENREAVMSKNAGTLEKLFVDCCELNGLTEKDVKELEKNSESGP